MRFHQRVFCLLLLLAVSSAQAADQAEKTRVACIGDSITYGSGIQDREQHSYPKVLGNLFGDDYDVRNLGVSGATLLKKGDKPYWNQDAFKQADAFRPNIVIIKLVLCQSSILGSAGGR